MKIEERSTFVERGLKEDWPFNRENVIIPGPPPNVVASNIFLDRRLASLCGRVDHVRHQRH
jgi:hypothetical protein